MNNDPRYPVARNVPTFDEWFKAKYFHTFEEMHCCYSMRIDDAMIALTRYVREYVTEINR